tara:strand:+ start:438 stop:641 length:204 start_codon:yes stop_codon:yes gene_type:complete
MCTNITTQTVPCGYLNADAKSVKIKCGNTGYYGDQVFCEECEKDGVETSPYYSEEFPLDCEEGIGEE